MSFNGSGTFSLASGNPVVTGTTISSSWANNTLSDIATGLSTAICKDGQTTITANIPLGGFKLTGIAAATTTGDALSYGRAASITALTVTSTADLTAATATAATQTAGDSSTKIATTAFVAATSFSTNLPGQTGNSGKFLTTDGANASWGRIPATRSARTSNTILAAADQGTFIDITSGTFSQTFTAAATLGNGWWCYIRNSGTGDITLDPNASETIDGLTTYVMYPGECRFVTCTGSAFITFVVSGFYRSFTTVGANTFTVPPGYTAFGGRAWGGGGSGGNAGASTIVGGGGGGACVPFTIASASWGSSQTVTIGDGGAAATGGNNGNAGSNTTIGTLVTAYGGGAGAKGANGAGGGGGGALSAGGNGGQGSLGAGGGPSAGGTGGYNAGYGGGGGGSGAVGSPSAFGGGGGGGDLFAGGASFYGGGGGGGGGAGSAAGGASTFGGAGGASNDSSNGVAGTAPGGGGGATRTGTNSGAGAKGQADIWGIF